MTDAGSVRDGRDRGLLFDLFGTLVFFDADRLPRGRVGGAERPVTIEDAASVLARLTPAPTLADLYEALLAVTRAFEAESGVSHRERSSRERFHAALESLRVEGAVAEVAEELSRRHMNGLASAVVCPPDRRALLADLRSRYRLALVSNFDHGPTAHLLLRRDGLRDYFDAVVVSEEIGLRKPHPKLFTHACACIGLAPSECLHVGDSHPADVHGATAAGLRAVWIDAGDAPIEPAVARLADVRELPGWLSSTAAD